LVVDREIVTIEGSFVQGQRVQNSPAAWVKRSDPTRVDHGERAWVCVSRLQPLYRVHCFTHRGHAALLWLLNSWKVF